MATGAAMLWAVQGPIWMFGPKVQASAPPHQIIDRPLFALFWLTEVAAIALSALTAIALFQAASPHQHPQRRQTARTTLLTRTGLLAARGAVAATATAATAVTMATVGVGESAAIPALAIGLNIAGWALLATLALAGLTIPRSGVLPGRQAILPALLAALTLLTLLAVTTAGLTTSTLALVGAVTITTMSAAAWATLGRALYQAPSTAHP
jgi:hypothetical protein